MNEELLRSVINLSWWISQIDIPVDKYGNMTEEDAAIKDRRDADRQDLEAVYIYGNNKLRHKLLGANS